MRGRSRPGHDTPKGGAAAGSLRTKAAKHIASTRWSSAAPGIARAKHARRESLREEQRERVHEAGRWRLAQVGHERHTDGKARHGPRTRSPCCARERIPSHRTMKDKQPVGNESGDPALEAAAQCELGTKDLVFAEEEVRTPTPIRVRRERGISCFRRLRDASSGRHVPLIGRLRRELSPGSGCRSARHTNVSRPSVASNVVASPRYRSCEPAANDGCQVLGAR
jgi:hypothetical protein